MIYVFGGFLRENGADDDADGRPRFKEKFAIGAKLSYTYICIYKKKSDESKREVKKGAKSKRKRRRITIAQCHCHLK